MVGVKVHIWDDKWIPTLTTFRVMSLRKHVVGENNVSSLIERDIGTWKSKVVRNNFVPHEANVILGIPLSSGPLSDSIVWTATSNGIFFVKSAYHVAKKLKALQNHGGLSSRS